MKIRNGFVSNSSSTSFCICGIESNIRNIKSEYINIPEEESFDRCSLNNTDLKVYSNLYDDWVYIGYDIDDMEAKETRKDFENRILKELNKILNDPITKVGFLYGEVEL